MIIEAYNFSKEPNSTKQPSSTGRQITCVLKDDCSLMHPVFLLNSWNLTDNYIKWGSRYYWIEDIVIKTKDHAEYHCKEDVLATYKSAIGSSSQYILRSSYAYTGSIIDGKYPALTTVLKTETELTTLHSNMVSSGFFVVGIQNGSTVDTGGVTYYALTNLDFDNLLNFMFAGTWLDTSGANITVALQKELINPMQYISSIVWFPMDFSTLFSGINDEVIQFGWWQGSNAVTGKKITSGLFVHTYSETVQLPRHHDAATRGTYLNGQPYTRHTLFCYSFGEIPIDASLFVESSQLTVSITLDLSTGDAKLSLIDASARLTDIRPGQFGVPVQISQIQQSLISPISNVVSGAVGLAYGNVVGFAQGIVSGIESMMPQEEVRGGTGSRLWYYRTPSIFTECRSIASEDKDHLGRPLCVRGTVQSYPGYIEVENADIDFACNFTELTEIKSFMESGFYYE